MDGDQIRFIREEIKRQINIIINSETGTTTSQTEVIQNLFPGMPNTEARPVVHPYGLVSRATQGTISVTSKTGDHPGNRMVLGHRDKSRPDLDEGEVMLYNSTGEQIYVKHGDIIFTGPKVHIGSKDAKEPFVLGLVFQKFTDTMLQLIEQHTHITSAPGALTSEPTNQLQFTQIRLDPIENSNILSDKIFGEKG